VPSATVDGATLHYEEAGAGAPVVLVHAFPLSSAMWAPQVEALADRYHLVTPDVRGFGASPPFGDRHEATMERLAADVVGLLDHLELDRVVLAGLSMGGYISLAVLRHHPDRVRAVVLADTRAAADTDEVRHRRSAQQVQVAEEGAGAIADAMVEGLLGATTRADGSTLVAQVRDQVAAASSAGVIGALEAMKARPDATGELGAVGVPALVVVGEEDTLAPPEVAEALAAGLPRARLVRVAGAGHLANLEQPDAFNAALADFLTDLDRP